MLIKLVIITLLFIIIFNLFRALFVMLKPEQNNKPMSSYLGRRVLFSAIALIGIVLASSFGLLKPNPTPFTAHKQTQINTAKQHQQSANTKLQPEMQNGAEPKNDL